MSDIQLQPIRQRDPIHVNIGTSVPIECKILSCSSRLSNCDLTHDWGLRFPHRNKVFVRISREPARQRNNTVDGLKFTFEPESFPPEILCSSGSDNYTFIINIMVHQCSPELKEFMVFCGVLRKTAISPTHYDIINVATVRMEGCDDKKVTDNITQCNVGNDQTKPCQSTMQSILQSSSGIILTVVCTFFGVFVALLTVLFGIQCYRSRRRAVHCETCCCNYHQQQ